MDLPTYTNIWRIKRVIYRFYDISLPRPVAADQLLLYAACFMAWIVLWWGIVGGTPFSLMHGREASILGFCWYLIPPWGMSLALSHPNDSEGKNPWQRATSWACYLAGPKAFDGCVSRRHIRWWLWFRSLNSRMPSFLRRPEHRERRALSAAPFRKVLAYGARSMRSVSVFGARSLRGAARLSTRLWKTAVRGALTVRAFTARCPRPRVQVSLTRPVQQHPSLLEEMRSPHPPLEGQLEELIADGRFPEDEASR